MTTAKETTILQRQDTAIIQREIPVPTIQMPPPPPTVDEVFPPGLDPGTFYTDYSLDRYKIDKVDKLLRSLWNKFEVADLAPLRMREGVDPNIIPSANQEIEFLRAELTTLDKTTMTRVWLMEKILAWHSPHERATRKLLLVRTILQEGEFQFQTAKSQFKRWLDMYGEQVLARTLYDCKDCRKNEKLCESHENEALELLHGQREWHGQKVYDSLRDLLWFAENIINAVNQSSQEYEEGSGMRPFEKRAREIMEERRQRETLTIERSTAS